MKRFCLGGLVFALALGACQSKMPSSSRPSLNSPKALPSKAPASQSPPSSSPRTENSGAPIASEAPTPIPSPLAVQARLKGQVFVDASYLLAKGYGQLVATGGGVIQATGLLSNHGANGLSPEATAQLVANHGGSFLATQEGALLSDAGGGLISNHGAGALNAIFRLLQSKSEPSIGQQLPAAGLAVRAFELQSGKAIPLVGPEGQALGAALTQADGGYQLNLALAPNKQVLVAAEVPGVPDPRLALRICATAQGLEAPPSTIRMDEDENVALCFMRSNFQMRLKELLISSEAELKANVAKSLLPEVAKSSFLDAVASLRKDSADAGFNALSETQQKQVAAGAADAILSTMDLNSITITAQGNPGWKGADELAIESFKKILKHMTAIAEIKLKENISIFDHDKDVIEYNSKIEESKKFLIRRPADFNAFCLEAFMNNQQGYLVTRSQHFIERYGSVIEVETGINQMDRLRAGLSSMMNAVGMALMLPEQGGKAAALSRIQEDCRRLGVGQELGASSGANPQ